MESEASHVTVETEGNVDVERGKKNILEKGISKAAQGARKSVMVVGSVWDDFKEFLNRGNVVDLAVGLVIGAAFTAIVTSMVNDLFTPLISLAIGSASLDNAFVLIACPLLNPNTTFSARGKIGKDCFQSQYPTVAIAKTNGAITWNYGSFLQQVINFLIIAVIVFFIVKLYAATFRRKKVKKEKECSFCCKNIPIKAKLCCFCTSNVEDITREVVENE